MFAVHHFSLIMFLVPIELSNYDLYAQVYQVERKNLNGVVSTGAQR